MLRLNITRTSSLHNVETNYTVVESRKNHPLLTRARLSDDGAVARDVPVLVLHPAAVPVSAIRLRGRGRGHAGGRGDADDGAVLSVLLPGLQNGRPVRRDDLQDDHGRPSEIRLHLPRLRYGIFPR